MGTAAGNDARLWAPCPLGASGWRRGVVCVCSPSSARWGAGAEASKPSPVLGGTCAFKTQTGAPEALPLIKRLASRTLKNGIDQVLGCIKEEFKRAAFCSFRFFFFLGGMSKLMTNVTTSPSRSAEKADGGPGCSSPVTSARLGQF